ncbi:MAG TPA: zinc metallopeptidase [Kofleriaceae bacterium]|nr:zinc metallopeptidase [Kofleriaceae bacterium]
MLHLIAVAWPLLLLLAVPLIANQIAVTIVRRVESRLDHAIPDELPVTAGEWLAERIRVLGLPLGAIVSDQGTNCYRPARKLIQLTPETHFKADPVFWSTAAHELGHARLRLEHPIVDALQAVSRRFHRVLVSAGVGLGIGYVLYQLPLAANLALACFGLAIAFCIPIVVEEALASRIALRELRSAGLADRELRASRTVLVLACCTYLSLYVAYALLLTQWPLLDRLADAFSTRGTLTPIGGWIAVVATILCSFHIVLRVLGVAFEDRLERRVPFWLRVIAALAIFVLVALVWDARGDVAFACCVMLALAASADGWRAVGMFPGALLGVAIARFVRRYEGRGIDCTPRYLRDRARGSAEIRRGNRYVAELRFRPLPRPALAWLPRLVVLGYLPLILLLWL